MRSRTQVVGLASDYELGQFYSNRRDDRENQNRCRWSYRICDAKLTSKF